MANKKRVKKPNWIIANHQMILAVLISLTVGAAGMGALLQSKASTIQPITSKSDCQNLLGRVWKNGGCSKSCQTGAGSTVSAWPYDYCSKAASNISYSICTPSKHRLFAYGVCMKVWGGHTTYGTYACASGYYRYHVANDYDYCTRT